MSLCTRNRWGTGSYSNYKETDTQSKKEVDDKLKQIQAERMKQDTYFFNREPTSSPSSSVVTNKLPLKDQQGAK